MKKSKTERISEINSRLDDLKRIEKQSSHDKMKEIYNEQIDQLEAEKKAITYQ